MYDAFTVLYDAVYNFSRKVTSKSIVPFAVRHVLKKIFKLLGEEIGLFQFKYNKFSFHYDFRIIKNIFFKFATVRCYRIRNNFSNSSKKSTFLYMKLFLQFATGVWYVTNKFDTKSACLTYEFKTDELGFKSIEQVKNDNYL
jgi:hypothetical protein